MIPLLFHCALEEVVREWWKAMNTRDVTLGKNPNNITIDCLAFADDWTLIITDSLDNVIKQQLQELQKTSIQIQITNLLCIF